MRYLRTESEGTTYKTLHQVNLRVNRIINTQRTVHTLRSSSTDGMNSPLALWRNLTSVNDAD